MTVVTQSQRLRRCARNSATAVLLTGLLALVRAQDAGSWQVAGLPGGGSPQARRRLSKAPDAAAAREDKYWPKFSEYSCVGVPRDTLTCQFKNLVYDRKEQQFLFFPAAQPPDEHTAALADLPYWENFHLKLVTDSGALPGRTRSCNEVEPVYLTNALRPYSFGHTVRDFFVTFTANLVELDMQHLTFKVAVNGVMPYVGLSDYDIARGMRVLRKYCEYIGDGTLWLKEIVDSCAPGKRFVLFRTLVAGSLMFDMKPEKFDFQIFPDRWGGCKSDLLQKHRDAAFALAHMPTVRPAYEHSQIRVLFGDKATEDSRRVDNVNELIPALQKRFPTFRFVNKVLTHLTAREQLEEMSSTSIFISPHASSSFRMVYLPDAAHSIIIGPPEMDGHDVYQAFAEINVCWAHVPYFSVGRYHVTERSERNDRFERGYRPDDPDIVAYYHWFDSDSHLNVTKLGDLIEDGVRQIREKGRAAMAATSRVQI